MDNKRMNRRIQMKNTVLFTAALVGLGLAQSASAAGVASLNDWCFNVNGDTSTLCNGGTSPTLTGSVGSVGVSGDLDLTLASNDPGFPTAASGNSLGSASFVLGPGANQYVNAYMDFELNYNNQGSFQDFAIVHNGPAPAGYAYEIDDPNSFTIFGDMAANTLTNVNSVGTYMDTSNNTPCCDVSWALGVTVSVADGFQDTITFVTSATAPVSGFYLEQQNGVDGTQIFLSASISEIQTGTGGPSTPEPGTFLLLGAGFAGVFAYRKRVRRDASV
jgi:hypothetical protein